MKGAVIRSLRAPALLPTTLSRRFQGFREGNGRSTRIWLDALLKKKLSKEDYLPAMEHNPIKAIELKHLPRKALTDRIRDRALWMRGIDRSYAYEGYAAFRAEDLT